MSGGGLSRMEDETAVVESDTTVQSNIDFLRAIEDDPSKQKHRRSSSQGKRASLQAFSKGGNILAGKFGDAFKVFESNKPRKSSQPERDISPPAVRRSPPRTEDTPQIHRSSSNRADNGYTARHNEDVLEEEEDLPPEMRRELERRRLSTEEKRVAAAAAEYRQRLAQKGGAGGGSTGPPPPSKASTIQNRVQSLLSDRNRVEPVKRTAEGYGRYTAEASPQEMSKPGAPAIARKPAQLPNQGSNLQSPKTRQTHPPVVSVPTPSASAPPAIVPAPSVPIQRTASRPSAPPKPKNLRTGGQFEVSVNRPASPVKPSKLAGSSLRSAATFGDATGDGAEDLEESFAKRYPDLGPIEMVEREV